MTTPRVTELPRRLEATSSDTFLGTEPDARPLAVVMPFRPRDAAGRRRSAHGRRNRRALFAVGDPGPGGDAA